MILRESWSWERPKSIVLGCYKASRSRPGFRLSASSIGMSVDPCFLRLYGVLEEYMAMSHVQGRCFEAIRLRFVVEISSG